MYGPIGLLGIGTVGLRRCTPDKTIRYFIADAFGQAPSIT